MISFIKVLVCKSIGNGHTASIFAINFLDDLISGLKRDNIFVQFGLHLLDFSLIDTDTKCSDLSQQLFYFGTVHFAIEIVKLVLMSLEDLRLKMG